MPCIKKIAFFSAQFSKLNKDKHPKSQSVGCGPNLFWPIYFWFQGYDMAHGEFEKVLK